MSPFGGLRLTGISGPVLEDNTLDSGDLVSGFQPGNEDEGRHDKSSKPSMAMFLGNLIFPQNENSKFPQF